MSNYILRLPGLSRYDVPDLEVKTNVVNNWQKYKQKLNLSANECKEIYNNVKKLYNIKCEEDKTKSSGTNLKFNKPFNSELFNNILRDYINKHKICSNCNVPELIDLKCNACGFCVNDVPGAGAGVPVAVASDTKEARLSKQEKRALKVAKEQEMSKKESNDSSESDELNNTMVKEDSKDGSNDV